MKILSAIAAECRQIAIAIHHVTKNGTVCVERLNFVKY